MEVYYTGNAGAARVYDVGLTDFWESGTGFEALEVENISPNNLAVLPTVFVGKK